MQHKMVKLADKMRPRLTDIKLSPPKVWQPLPQQPSCQRCPADNSLVPQPGWAQGNFGHTLHILAHNIRISFWAGITYSFVDRFFLRQEIYFLLAIDLCNFLSTFFCQEINEFNCQQIYTFFCQWIVYSNNENQLG